MEPRLTSQMLRHQCIYLTLIPRAALFCCDGQSIVLTFSEDISASNDVQTDSFVIKVNGSPVTPASVSGSDTIFTLNLSSSELSISLTRC